MATLRILWFGGQSSFGIAPARLMCGGSTSFTTIVCGQDWEFPPPSVAVHVIVVLPTGNGSVRARPSPRTPVTFVGQPSASTTGVPGFTTAEHKPGSLGAMRSAGQVMLTNPFP